MSALALLARPPTQKELMLVCSVEFDNAEP
jgi:hypothetical protein